MSKHEPTEEMILAGVEAVDRTMPYVSDTHRVVPVKPTGKMIAAAIPELMREGDEDKYRALGQLICVWDALLAATKEKGE